MSSTITVPEGMSCVNAFRALWENSKPPAFFSMFPDSRQLQAEEVSTAEKVAHLFKSHTFFDYEGGRKLKTDFSKFPKLSIGSYDRDCGQGAAQRAVEAYAKIPSCKRFDANDSYKFEAVTSWFF